MSDSGTTKLPETFSDAEEAATLNAGLTSGKVELDWSGVTTASDAALDALVAGLSLDKVADDIGADTMSEDIQATVIAAFERQPSKKRPSAKKATVKASDSPAVWQAPQQPAALAAAGANPTPAAKPGPPAPQPILNAPAPVDLRAMLEDAVSKDLLGPAGGDYEELHDSTPRDRYLVGMLAPRRLRVRPEEAEGIEVEIGGGSEEGVADANALVSPTMFPSAIGLSFVAQADAALKVTARWGRYFRGPSEELETATGKPKTVWKREPMVRIIDLPALSDGPFGPFVAADNLEDPAEQHVIVRGLARKVGDAFVVSLFLVNVQDEPEKNRDEAWLFQPELTVRDESNRPVFASRAGLVSNLAGVDAYQEPEARLTAMLYRDQLEFAVGHGVSVHAQAAAEDPRHAVSVSTEVVPSYEVPQTTSPSPEDGTEFAALGDLVLDMKALAETPRAQLQNKLRALPDAYQQWIDGLRSRAKDPAARLDGFSDEVAKSIANCEQALGRIRDGLTLLASNDRAADAFQFANRAMWLQRVHTVLSEGRRQGHDTTLEDVDVEANRSWRVFQLAFLLLNLDSVTNLHHAHRSDPHKAVADLLWFPTGGGKTEAYLGLAAYTMALRRLQGEIAGRSGEYGVAVLMRYTLRLLTLQQFQRAAALVCACEFIRKEAETAGNPVWGHEPFRIGLWVGARSTPNKTAAAAEALKRTRDIGFRQASSIGGQGSPVQLKSCPWCGSTIDPGRHIKVEPFKSGAGRTLTHCGDRSGHCPFSRKQSPTEGLPVVVVDEEVYRRLPTLLIATVDKFAQMPWKGAVQMLFGRVTGYCERHGFASPDLPDTDHPKRGNLPRARLQEHGFLRPPDLIIQDELHLISGPLGTLTGLYETAVDQLCSWDVGGKTVRPKVIASTATIRRAESQIRSLFLRDVQVFPPQGLDVANNFFSLQRPISDLPGRRYVGICAPGRRLKAAIIRVYVAYLAAAQALYERYGLHADPWMTLVGYFSSLRELAGTRRLVDDDVSSRVKKMDRRGLANRFVRSVNELTSRMGSTEIPDLLDRLGLQFDPVAEANRKQNPKFRRPLDVLLATNMVSVGVDVPRLGLMVVAGQPKNTAEYIQATSRVGRSHPGVVCTIYNWARPRDLSHYESFEHYHSTFYNHVEALSVTPFAPRALDRGLTALLVALIRLTEGKYSPNEAAAQLDTADPIVKQAIQSIASRAAAVEEAKAVGDSVEDQLQKRLDEWGTEAANKPGGARLGYKAKRDGVTRELLKPAGLSRWETFTCLNSLRDVEPTVDLVLEDGGLDEDGRPFGGDT